MPRNRNGCDPLRRLSEAIAAQAAERDRNGGFASEVFAALAAEGLLSDRPRDTWPLLRLLAAVGRGDLSDGVTPLKVPRRLVSWPASIA